MKKIIIGLCMYFALNVSVFADVLDPLIYARLATGQVVDAKNDADINGVKLIELVLDENNISEEEFLKQAELLLSKNINLNVTNEEGLNVFHFCAIQWLPEVLKLIKDNVSQGKYKDAINATLLRNNEAYTPLKIAAGWGGIIGGNPETIKTLLEMGAGLDFIYRKSGNNFLHELIRDGDIKSIRAVFETAKEKDLKRLLNGKNKTGLTPKEFSEYLKLNGQNYPIGWPYYIMGYKNHLLIECCSSKDIYIRIFKEFFEDKK